MWPCLDLRSLFFTDAMKRSIWSLLGGGQTPQTRGWLALALHLASLVSFSLCFLTVSGIYAAPGQSVGFPWNKLLLNIFLQSRMILPGKVKRMGRFGWKFLKEKSAFPDVFCQGTVKSMLPLLETRH